jgi:acyl transferase domain-containing protein
MADLGSGATAAEPFAIVGLSLKLPGGVIDEKSLWKVVESATNLRSEWPESRILLDSFEDGGQGGKPNTVSY